MPLSIISWKEAVSLWYDNKASVLSVYDNWAVHSPSVEFDVPAVIMLNKYVRPEAHVKYSRYNVYLRDEFHCQYCGEKFDKDNLTLDHVVPRYHGGRTTWSNVVACCMSCNRDKAHFLDMRPLKKPRRPDYYEMIQKRKNIPVVIYHPSWKDYIGWDENLIIEKYGEEQHHKMY